VDTDGINVAMRRAWVLHLCGNIHHGNSACLWA